MKSEVMNNDNLYAIFVQSQNDETRCLTLNRWQLLSNGEDKEIIELNKGEIIINLVRNQKQNCSDLLGSLKLNKLLIAAELDIEYPLLQSTSPKGISADWFDNLDSNNIGVFFVNGGKKLFTQKKWANRFKQWVSFGEEFDTLEEHKIPENFRSELYKEFMLVVLKHDNSQDILTEFQNILVSYRRKIVTDIHNEDFQNYYHDITLSMASLVYNVAELFSDED